MEVRSRGTALQRDTALRDENSIDDGLGEWTGSDDSDIEDMLLANLKGSSASRKLAALFFLPLWISIIYFLNLYRHLVVLNLIFITGKLYSSWGVSI